MQTSDYIAISALVLSIVSFIYSYVSNTKKYELHYEYRCEILKWYKETNLTLIRLKIETKKKSTDEELKRKLLAELSANIELGRFYFPNLTDNINFGNDKPIAYRGYRNLTLDFLVFSYRLFDEKDAINYLHHAEALQRYFTSSIFEIVEPRKFLQQTEKLTNKAFTKELSFEDFIDKEPELLLKYIKNY